MLIIIAVKLMNYQKNNPPNSVGGLLLYKHFNYRGKPSMMASYILIIANERVKVKENLKLVSFLSQYLRTVLRQSLIFAINQLN